MYSADGIGLAVPQVAVQKQLIVIDWVNLTSNHRWFN